ncbi:SDR family oxidoreductase [Lentzea sp. NPDC051838]|uniref:SDR family oxidoreductase n=1 Tax=Lentzea sp. NPDC051838 TaxID=3154849 RepID=UPI00341FC73A
MRVAVVGASGRIGSLTVAALHRDGHDVVPISRTHGVDVIAGTGLDEALKSVAAVVDTTSVEAATEAEAVGFFTTAAANLLAAEQRAGVGHHVVLSIARVRTVPGNPHHAGKRAQEDAVEAGPIPYTIVPATQFYDFPATFVGWVEHDGVAQLPPLLMQPIAPADVADVLARVAVGTPQGRHRDIAGPETHELVDMARRTLAVQGRSTKLVATWHGGVFDETAAGDVLLPAADAEIAPTTFDEWLAAQRS